MYTVVPKTAYSYGQELAEKFRVIHVVGNGNGHNCLFVCMRLTDCDHHQSYRDRKGAHKGDVVYYDADEVRIIEDTEFQNRMDYFIQLNSLMKC